MAKRNPASRKKQKKKEKLISASRISSSHRNKKLAMRELRELENLTDLKIKVQRRNKKGQFSSRGKSFTFIIAKPKSMYRLTISISYAKKKQYQSYKLTKYFKTRRAAVLAIDAAIQETIEGLEGYLKYDRKEFWFNLARHINEEIAEVPYNENLLNLGAQYKNEIVE